jgi:RHS repeat-associated protein
VATWRDEQGGKGEWFQYNALGQLMKVRYNADQVWTGSPSNWNRWVDYDYTDGLLNRYYVNDNGNMRFYGAAGTNQYTGIWGSAAPSYDGNFNLTAYNGFQGVYDAENHLVGGSMRATYDGLGRCVRRTTPSGTLLSTYDGWKPILEWGPAGNWTATNVYGAGADEILARQDSAGRILIYKQDQHGNVVAVLTDNGDVTEKYTYDAFGKPKIFDKWGNLRSATAVGNRFLFQGREWIAEPGIYDYRHRMYQPDLGRFLQVDPLGLQTEGEKLSTGQKALFSPGGVAPDAFGTSEMNLFRYCGDDPLDGSDPLGLRDVDVYIWDIDVSHQSVGHVMVTEHDSHTVLLSQFPQRSGPKGANIRLSFDETVRREHRRADHVITTHVRDDKAFDRTVRDHATRPYWYWNPSKPNETHCARSTYDALRDGGVGVWGHDRGQVLPRDIRQQLEQTQRDNFEVAHPKPVRQ